MSDSTGETKPPAFFCPKCGQKHRADLAPLRGRPGASVQVACRACQVKFRVRLDGERPVCDALPEADGAAPKAAIPTVVPPKVVPPKAAPPKVVPPKAAIPKVVPPKVVPPKVVPPEAVPPEAVPPKAVSPPPAPVPPRPAPPTPETAFAEGEKVGRYTVRGLLQHGDTSTVYRAHDPKTKRSVALKVLRADAPASVRRRFLRQVHVQANIRHQNVMPVYDREELEDGRPIFTMELVHQPHTLAGLLEDRASGKLATARKLAPLAEIEGLIEHVLLPIAEGVYVANVENGVIHGDLRPANVLVDGRTLRPYLMDFGRSGALEDAAGVDAREDSPYLAPEQRRGEENPRTDVWGLGALLHVILTGQAPRARLTGQAPRADAEEMYSPDVPPALAAIAQKAMAEEPDARYVNARQFATDLKAWRKGGRVWALEEYAGPVTTAEDKRRALKRYLQTALWIGAGLLVGTLVGSRIQIGGEDAYVIHAADAEAAVNRLDEAIERLGPEASSLEPEDAYGIWASLQARADDILTRLRKAPPSAGRDAMEERVAFVRGRIAPLPVAVEVPEGTHVRYANAVSGTPWTPPPGNRTRLPPGRWNVEVGDAYRFPVAIPLRVRKAGEDPATEAVVATWTIPVDPDDLPATYALVIGRPVRLAGPPQTAALAMRRVSTFAIDRRKVTCADYAHFLAALPAKERDASVPTTGFEKDATGTWVPGTGSADRPLTGVRPLDAERFATWRSAREGATLRLPTEAEWLLASDSPLFEWSRGDLAPAVDDRTRALPSLLAPPREMMIRSTAGDETPAVVARGRVRAEMPLGEALNEAVVLSATSPAPATGFRLVRAFP